MIATPIKSTDLLKNVTQIFADVTRYPIDILTTDANLEEDLGIDSVKLGEVFSVIREQYDTPAEMDIPEEQIKTIGGITQALAAFLKENNHHEPSQNDVHHSNNGSTANTSTITNNNIISIKDLEDKVVDIFQEVTRYPREVLGVDANLEEDLGIDSVKLGEVFSVIREQYDTPTEMDIPEEQIKTIGGITQALATFLKQNTTNSHTHEAVQQPNIQTKRTTPNSNSQASSATNNNTTSPKPLEGKIAFISGSGRGLGKNIAEHLAALGAKVYVNSFHSRNQGEATVATIKEQGGKAVHLLF